MHFILVQCENGSVSSCISLSVTLFHIQTKIELISQLQNYLLACSLFMVLILLIGQWDA